MNKNVLLVYCEEKASMPRIPQSIISIGSYIRKKGFNPILLDLRLDDFSHINFRDFFCIGISTLTGPGIKYGRTLAKEAKKQNPSITIVWGGPHATLFLEQTLQDEFVDVIVRSEGEESFMEILNNLTNNKSFDNVKGISYKKNNKAIHNPDREFMEVDKLDFPAYDLLPNIKRYADLTEEFGYEASRGCPHRCQFCYCLNFHKKKWRPKTAKHVLQDLKKIEKTYNPRKIFFMDDNFFVDKKRVMDIAKGLIKMNSKLKWGGCIRVDYLSTYTDEEVELMKKSGCWFLGMGAESGSERGLDIIKKDIIREQTIIATKKCIKFGILPQISFVIGFVGERKKDMMETLSLYDEVMKLGKNVEANGVFIYFPIPGTPMYYTAVNNGYKPKNSFEDWSTWRYNDPKNTPWWSENYKSYLNTIAKIARFKYFMHRLKHSYSKDYLRKKLKTRQNKILFALFMPLYKASAYLRWKHRFFSHGYEWKLFTHVCKKKFEVY